MQKFGHQPWQFFKHTEYKIDFETISVKHLVLTQRIPVFKYHLRTFLLPCDSLTADQLLQPGNHSWSEKGSMIFEWLVNQQENMTTYQNTITVFSPLSWTRRLTLSPLSVITWPLSGSNSATLSWIQSTPFGVTDNCGLYEFEYGLWPAPTNVHIGW